MTTKPALTPGATAGAGPSTGPGSGVSRALLLLLAFACGLIVANNYYAQPLLPDLAHSLHTSSSVIGLCVTLNQLGYALGLVLLVPLGDLLAKRRMITTMLALDAVALAAAAASNGPAMLLVTLALVGLTGSAINVIIPMTATLARADQRGRVVGTLMSGLLLGILLARTVAGGLGQLAGWRVVYAAAAVAIALLAVVLRLRLPDIPARRGTSYARLLGSVATMVRREPFLRRRMAVGLLGFACFQTLWTAMPFLLSGRSYGYSTATIGLFGLLGAAGALCAQPAGKLQDRGRAHAATGVLVLVLGASWAALGGGRNLALLIVGILLLDIGVQGLHVLNQARIYTYGPEVRSRVTTAYMSSYFLGGSLGGAIAVPLYDSAGWGGVCVAGAVLTALAAAVWLTDRTAARSAAEAD
jgi:predicted MFS family arabinose efflux permease